VMKLRIPVPVMVVQPRSQQPPKEGKSPIQE